MIELHAIFHGRVQGVFFRSHAKKYAEALGLAGTVKNLPDGTVELYAQGSEEAVNHLIEKLRSREGPGEVAAVEKEFFPIQEKLEGFRVIH